MTAAQLLASHARREVLRRRIRIIVGITIVYNLVEAAIAISAGAAASSVALIGFGLDSTIEVLSAAAVAWQFTRRDPERWERATLRVIAVAFFLLAAYVAVSSLLALTARTEVRHSTLGIVLTAVSVVIMPFLSLAERRAGRELGSATAIADSKQTLICTYLSAAVLLGLVLNSLLSWWWADSSPPSSSSSSQSERESRPGRATPAPPRSACSSRRSATARGMMRCIATDDCPTAPQSDPREVSPRGHISDTTKRRRRNSERAKQRQTPPNQTTFLSQIT